MTLGNPRYKFDICKSYCKRKCAFLLDFCWVVYEELQNKDVYLCTTLKIPVWQWETPKINVIKKAGAPTRWTLAHLWYPRFSPNRSVGIWRGQKHFPRYRVPIWSLWPNIRFLPSIVAEKNVTKNVHIQMYVKCV